MLYVGISIFLLLISLFLFYKTVHIKNQKRKEQQQIDTEIKKSLKEKQLLQQSIHSLTEELTTNQHNIIQLQKQSNILKKEIDLQIQEKRNNIDEFYNNLKQKSKQAFYSYEQNLDATYTQIQKNFHQNIMQLEKQKEQKQNQFQAVSIELTQVKNAVQAATAARLIQQEENNKWLFYSLDLTDNQLNDILELNNFKHRLNDPSLISKIIWSAFVLKATNDLCNRVLGSIKKCGIYKITNRETKQTYIGQSLNISDRWKAHIKCGLGIDAPATNKLYNKMQYYGVWMFTFELLEECPKEKLNEREKFWIDFYQSDKTGMNSTKGNK